MLAALYLAFGQRVAGWVKKYRILKAGFRLIFDSMQPEGTKPMFTGPEKPVERAWVGGPLRQCHLPVWDKRVKYVCDDCRLPALTGVRLDPARREWLCASCERGLVRST